MIEMTQKLEQAIELLTQIIEDKSVPRNIRENTLKAKESLESKEKDITIKVDKALQLLDEISNDPNLSTYTRTQVWSVSTLLESFLYQ